LWDHAPFETFHLAWRLTNTTQETIRIRAMLFRFVHIMAHAEDFSVLTGTELGPGESSDGSGSWFSEWIWLLPKITFQRGGNCEETHTCEVDLDGIRWPEKRFRSDGFRAAYNDIATIKRSHVLILGKDTGAELEGLISIKEKLSNYDLIGVLLKDLRDIPEQTVEEKLVLCAAAVSFAIVENTVPSGHIDELRILATNRVVTAIIQKSETGASWIQADYPCDFNFIKSFEYSESPMDCLNEVVGWARALIMERIGFLNRLYPTTFRFVNERLSDKFIFILGR